MKLFARLRHRLTTLRCPGCGERYYHLYGHFGDWRCNPCITRRLRSAVILHRLERDGILTIVQDPPWARR